MLEEHSLLRLLVPRAAASYVAFTSGGLATRLLFAETLDRLEFTGVPDPVLQEDTLVKEGS